jgi:hypothetical protein
MIQILHLYQQRSAADYIGKVFDNDSLFNYRTYNISNVDVGQFKNANLIVLEGVEQINGSFKASLEEFIRKGGSIFIIPPTQADVASYNQFLNPFGIQRITPNAVPIAPQSQLAVAEPNKQNPFYADVFERTTVQGVVNTPNMQPALSWSGVGEKVLIFKNLQNFITLTTANQGKIYLCASPLEKAYGNFAEHAFFVPTMFKVASLSVKQERAAYNFSEGSIKLGVVNARKNATYKLKSVTKPNDKLEIIPIQRVTENELVLELPKSSQLADNQVLESGYYELQLDGKTEKLLALNHDSEESKMDFYQPEELKNLFAGQKNITVFDNLLDGDFVKTFQENNIGTPLWKYCIILALVFLLIEILLIRLMR